MVPRLPTLTPRDDREREVIRVWRAGGLRDSSIGVYLHWVRRWRARWASRAADEVGRLRLRDVLAFARGYVGPRCRRPAQESSRLGASNALHAWACALRSLGLSVPPWRPPPLSKRPSPLIQEFREYRRAHCGVADGSLVRDMTTASAFLKMLRARDRRVFDVRVCDVDHFVETLSARLSRRTVAGLCSSLRCFLRFLHVSGRIRVDVASTVVAPRFRLDERPPRALPWNVIRRILRAIPRDQAEGRRDFAMLLLMATYGLGASEVVRLRLDDLDWRGRVLRTRRAKTDVPLALPLLPNVFRAIVAYLRGARPQDSPAREVFLRKGLPHQALSTGALRHVVRRYAGRVGLVADVIGTHVFRHSLATRQVEAGVPPKIISDILGHKRPASTSVYVRLAVERLRTVALPVPR